MPSPTLLEKNLRNGLKMFTRNQINEYFSSHSKATIDRALTELAKYDPSIDPKGDSFDDLITEQLEQVLETLDEAIALNLPVQETTAFAVSKGQQLGFPQQIFESLVTAAIEEGVITAIALNKVKTDTVAQTSAYLAVEELKNSQELTNAQIAFVTQIMGDKSKLDAVLQTYGVRDAVVPEPKMDEKFDVDEYLQECRLGESPKLHNGDRTRLIASLVKAATNE